jgi:FAD/FMN-containing dehydrogenase
MIANNAAGMRSVRYDMTIDHVLEIDLALASCEVLNLSALDTSQWSTKATQQDREGIIHRRYLCLKF